MLIGVHNHPLRRSAARRQGRARETMISDDWQPWFAWYPVCLYGYAEGPQWRASRWTWLRRVEWANTMGVRFYRLPTATDVREKKSG
jgi:hypothetical protein